MLILLAVFLKALSYGISLLFLSSLSLSLSPHFHNLPPQAPERGDDCEQFVRIGQPVSLLTIDKTHGSILAATNDVIR